jgi:hypothetical protein
VLAHRLKLYTSNQCCYHRLAEIHTESCDLLAVLDQLHPDALPDGRVWLLGFDTNFFEDNALGVRGATEGRRLVCGSEEALLVVEIGPATLPTMVAELTGGVESSRLSFTHVGGVGGWCGERWSLN